MNADQVGRVGDAPTRSSARAATTPSSSTASPAAARPRVYLRAIEEVVRQGKEAIVLVPEISLTPQTIERFSGRCGTVAVLHSHLTDSERGQYWRRVAAGQVQVVVGARSAVFAPTRKLGVIIIDEEHETSFKQESTPRYHARDVAVMRARLANVPIILGSATPSLESWHNAHKADGYTLLSLPNRVENRPLPKVQLVDLRHEPKTPGKHFAIGPTLEAGDQERPEGGRPGDALPQPPRVQYARPLPELRPRRPVRPLRPGPDVPPAQGRPRLPLLRLGDGPVHEVPELLASVDPLPGPRHREVARRDRGEVPEQSGAADGLRHDVEARQPPAGTRRLPRGPHPHPARHADDREGAGLPERHARRRGERRRGPAPAGLPRRRAHVPTARASLRPGRPRREGRAGDDPDVHAGPPVHQPWRRGTTSSTSRSKNSATAGNTTTPRINGSPD